VGLGILLARDLEPLTLVVHTGTAEDLEKMAGAEAHGVCEGCSGLQDEAALSGWPM